MNDNQKKVIAVTAGLVVLMLLFPPFHHYYQNGVEVNMGYAFLLNPPSRGYISGSVNILQLLIQWVGVGVVGGLIYFLLKGSER